MRCYIKLVHGWCKGSMYTPKDINHQRHPKNRMKKTNTTTTTTTESGPIGGVKYWHFSVRTARRDSSLCVHPCTCRTQRYKHAFTIYVCSCAPCRHFICPHFWWKCDASAHAISNDIDFDSMPHASTRLFRICGQTTGDQHAHNYIQWVQKIMGHFQIKATKNY